MEKVAQHSARLKSPDATAQEGTLPSTTTDTARPVHREAAGGALTWLGTAAFCTASGCVVLALAAITFVLFQLCAELCISGAFLKIAAQPYQREMEPVGVLTFILAVVGPPIGVFGSIIWVVSTSRRNSLSEYRAQMTALRQGSCFAQYTNVQHLLRCKVGFSRLAEFLAVVALVTYIAIVIVATGSALWPRYPTGGFFT